MCAALWVQWFAFSLETHISLSFDFAKDGIPDILHSRKHHKVQTASYTQKEREWGGGVKKQTLLTIKIWFLALYYSWSGPMPCGAVSCDSKLWELLKSHWFISQFVTMVPWSQSTKIKASLRDGFGPLVRERSGGSD